MRVVEKLKLNKFRDVVVPEPKALYQRFGFSAPDPCKYTGDEPAIMPANKCDQLADYAEYAEQEAKKAFKSE